MKRIALLTTALVAIGYSHGRTETVLVKGSDGPIRVNKDDFDADQAGEKKYTAYHGKDGDDAPSGDRSDVNVTGNGVDGQVLTTAAPSTPNFSGPAGSLADPIDQTKNAVAPVSTTADQLLVMKQGKKFFITDGMGQKITGDRAKLLKIDERGYDSEETAKAVQTHTNPEPSPN